MLFALLPFAPHGLEAHDRQARNTCERDPPEERVLKMLHAKVDECEGQSARNNECNVAPARCDAEVDDGGADERDRKVRRNDGYLVEVLARAKAQGAKQDYCGGENFSRELHSL